MKFIAKNTPPNMKEAVTLMKTKNQIFFYGLGGAEQQFRVLNFEFIDQDMFSVWTMNHVVDSMMFRNPSIVEIYMVDNRRGLKRDFMDSIRVNSVESCQIFKDILRREGIKVYPANR